jgi:pyruvate dehydrogenase E2 component (dihydrolipoamide acetyltransferase)
MDVIRMPMMGNTMETGTLVEWRVGEGDDIAADEVVAVVESEKASGDVHAKQDGVLARVDVEVGETVPPGTTMGVVLGPDEELADAPPPRHRIGVEEEASGASPGGTGGDGSSAAARAEDGSSRDERTEDVSGVEAEGTSGGGADDLYGGESGADEETVEDRVPAAPGARKLAAESGVDLDAVAGTGPDGAVLIADVEEHLETAAVVSGTDGTERRAFATPTTRRIARELGVDVAAVEGTGVGGRVTASDVRAVAGAGGGPTDASAGSAGNSATGRAAVDPESLGVTVVEERPLSEMRATIAERMSRSARDIPHVTLDRTVPVARPLDVTDELDADGVGFTDVLLVAVAHALGDHPSFNAWFQDGVHQVIDEVNIGVATDVEDGLVTPVVRNVDDSTIREVARERREVVDRTIAGEFTMDDLRGGTFTVTNLGPFGVDAFDPIIDPPQVGILGVGRIREDDGRTVTLSLSFDHRVVDGADAARFLDSIATALEAPTRTVLERSTAKDDRSLSGAADGEAPAGGWDERGSDLEALGASAAADLLDRASEVARANGWSASFEDVSVSLSGDGPTVTVLPAPDVSDAMARRLAYAACRESTYADVVAGLRDPVLEVRDA